MKKIIGFLFYIINTIIVMCTVALACAIDSEGVSISYYIVMFLGIIWCAVCLYIYDLNYKRKENDEKCKNMRIQYKEYVEDIGLSWERH